tara:strand:+ start:9822 stop:12317 length:2496 start_codon:yes stop_codon:yes gene_type:complete
MMKGREDDRRLFERGVKLNVMAMVDSTSLDIDTLVHGIDLSQYGLSAEDLTALKELFEHATTFGSLIQVPQTLAEKLPALKQLSETNSQDMFVKEVLEHLAPLVKQAEKLAAQYDAVVANPPYIGAKGMSPEVKVFTKNNYSNAKSDLFSCFIERSYVLSKDLGRVGTIAPFVWMFISSYEEFRSNLLDEVGLSSLIQLEYNAFEPACIPVATFTFMRRHIKGFIGSYIRLSDFKGHQNQAPKTKEAIANPECNWFYRTKTDAFEKLPGSPIAYWLSDNVRNAYESFPLLSKLASARQGLKTGENERFLRLWQEVSQAKSAVMLGDNDRAKWFACAKGGEFRRWYGNHEYVLNWENDGFAIRNFFDDNGRLRSRPQNIEFFFRLGFTWSTITVADVSFRRLPGHFVFESTGSTCFPKDERHAAWLHSALNSSVISYLLHATSPTLNYSEGAISSVPIPDVQTSLPLYEDLLDTATRDWDAYERSWDFKSFPILVVSSVPTRTIKSSYIDWISQNNNTIAEMKYLEEENNRLFIDAYGLADELTPEVLIEKITLTVNPAYRYGVKGTEEERNTRFREDTMAELVSYAIGCMMGRYSLDEPGLIYANSGNEGFDDLVERGAYTKFPADDDGIIPLTDKEWFADDAANRLVEFISVAWDESHLEENLNFLAANLSPKKGEDSRDTIRRYLCDRFYKDHLQTYKKRPIYWLFSSGKQKAFQCLVYLHRYNEGTLARMRTEYVIPLTAKLSTHVNKLENDIQASASTAEIKKLEKEIAQLHKQQAELSTFDEKLRHFADQRISLDLDDGVKVNYGKFGDLLAEVKAITGEAPVILI